MAQPRQPLPPEVIRAIQLGRLTEAAQLLRAETGLGTAEARQRIDHEIRHNPPPTLSANVETELPPAVMDALRRGDKTEAVRLLVSTSGLKPKQALLLIDRAVLLPPEPAPPHADATPFGATHTPQAGGLAPGELGEGRDWSLWVIVAALLGLAGYWLWFRG